MINITTVDRAIFVAVIAVGIAASLSVGVFIVFSSQGADNTDTESLSNHNVNTNSQVSSSLTTHSSVQQVEATKQKRVHEIVMRAVNMTGDINKDGLGRELYAYEMEKHVIIIQGKHVDESQTVDVTEQYDDGPTVPGPALQLQVGDKVNIKLKVGGNINGCVSIHPHGVHYDTFNDGVLGEMKPELTQDQCAEPGKPFTFSWEVGDDSVGTWLYHDHTLGADKKEQKDRMVKIPTTTFEKVKQEAGKSVIGEESRGLFGTIIVDPPSGQVRASLGGKQSDVAVDDISKEFILFMLGTRFAGMEIDNSESIEGIGKQTGLWENPIVHAKLGDPVRFHVLSVGSNKVAFSKMRMEKPMTHLVKEHHTFHLHGHRWLETGTTRIIDVQSIGPAMSWQFTVKAGEFVGPGQWTYHCHVVHHMNMGMFGAFRVTEEGGPSIAGEKFPVVAPAGLKEFSSLEGAMQGANTTRKSGL